MRFAKTFLIKLFHFLQKTCAKLIPEFYRNHFLLSLFLLNKLPDCDNIFSTYIF